MYESNIIADNTFNCIFLLDTNLKVRYWNTSMEVISGIHKNAALGKNIFELIPSLSDECEYYFNEAILKENRIIELHTQHITAPISKNKIALRARYMSQTKDGKTIGICGIWQQLYYNYQESNYLNLLESVIVNTNDAVIITRSSPIEAPSGPIIIYSNPAFSKMTGYAPHELLGKTPRILQGKYTSKATRESIKTALINWESVQQEILNYTKSGEKFWVDLSIVPVKNTEGHYTHWIAIQRNITKRKEDQEQLERLNNNLEKMVKERTKELEQFIYFASHDLKEPLRMIHSFLDLLKKNLEGKLDQNSIEYLEFVQKGAKTMKIMIEGLYSYSNIQKTKLKLQHVNFVDVIHAAQNNLTFAIKESQTTLNIGAMPIVSIDFSLMINVVQNLIINAITHSNKSPIIDISSSENKDYHIIEIKDNGLGINAESFKDIFNMFKKVNRDKDKGNGVGLAICKNIIEKHKGIIRLTSKEGKGSSFFIHLPKI